MTVGAESVTTTVDAYAQVQGIATLPVDAAESGVVADLDVLPGAEVRAGKVLARLAGPEIGAVLAQDEAAVRGAEAQVAAAEQALGVEREQLLTHLSTQQLVAQAESAQKQAQANLDNAQSRLETARQLTTVASPVAATVLTLNAATGELVSAGQPLLTLQPADRLWLEANYYGADLAAVRPGMRGNFVPADGSPPVPVKVSARLATAPHGGGQTIALLPAAPAAEWIFGESGTVTLEGRQRRLVTVPTRALVLDQGQWWVMVHTARGDRPQAVVPGPASDWNTVIESGLAPGTQVLVANAYLRFHAGIAHRYQLPD
ncbi:MAG: efflux RND transporter periplasmic adaptor subunit [Terriglobales bacterium]